MSTNFRYTWGCKACTCTRNLVGFWEVNKLWGGERPSAPPPSLPTPLVTGQGDMWKLNKVTHNIYFSVSFYNVKACFPL